VINMEQPLKSYFAFSDESGNSTQERFFGLGLLLVDDEIGSFYDAMKPYYDRIFEMSRLQKFKRLEILRHDGAVDELFRIANSTQRFELKFRNINFTTNLVYQKLIERYFTFPNVRFCVLVVDRQSLPRQEFDPWAIYIHRVAMLLVNNMKNINPCRVCLLADDLTRPKSATTTFEQSLQSTLTKMLAEKGMNSSLFGVTRLESHSSLLLQIVDVLLGCVMYDFKKENGLISEKLAQRQEGVVEQVRKTFGVTSLAANKTYHTPNYLSVWKFQK
jgi:hypothetical protein